MKQKLMRIMTLFFVVALVFVMACPAFAAMPSQHSLPALPVTDNPNWIVRWSDGDSRYSAHNYESVEETATGIRVTGDEYFLRDGVWNYWGRWSQGILTEFLVYDSSGVYASSDYPLYSETVSYVVSGVYQLKLPFTLEGFDFDVTFDTPVKLYSGDQTYTEYRSISKLDDNLFLRFYGNTDNGNSGVTGETYIGINSETVTYIDFGSTPQEVSEDFYNWLGGNTSFFRQVPSLTQVVSSSALEMVMTEVVAILPVGITFLVGYLALRKAFRVLERVLYQA